MTKLPTFLLKRSATPFLPTFLQRYTMIDRYRKSSGANIDTLDFWLVDVIGDVVLVVDIVAVAETVPLGVVEVLIDKVPLLGDVVDDALLVKDVDDDTLVLTVVDN